MLRITIEQKVMTKPLYYKRISMVSSDKRIFYSLITKPFKKMMQLLSNAYEVHRKPY